MDWSTRTLELRQKLPSLARFLDSEDYRWLEAWLPSIPNAVAELLGLETSAPRIADEVAALSTVPTEWVMTPYGEALESQKERYYRIRRDVADSFGTSRTAEQAREDRRIASSAVSEAMAGGSPEARGGLTWASARGSLLSDLERTAEGLLPAAASGVGTGLVIVGALAGILWLWRSR